MASGSNHQILTEVEESTKKTKLEKIRSKNEGILMRKKDINFGMSGKMSLRPDSLLRLWRYYINHLLTYLLIYLT